VRFEDIRALETCQELKIGKTVALAGGLSMRPVISQEIDGAGERDRTSDRLMTNQLA
jgi:hypothetical protein